MHKSTAIASSLLAALILTPGARAETPHERSVRIQKIDKEVFAREHEIQKERSAGKITKEQAIAEKKAILEKSKQEHAK